MVMLKNKIGLNSNVKTLKNVILKKPKDAFKSQKFIDEYWESLNFISKPEYKTAIHQYDNLIKILNPLPFCKICVVMYITEKRKSL